MPKWIDWSRWDHLLGAEMDVEIAKKIGCCPSSISYRRAKLEIPNGARWRRVDWSKWDHLLGVESDPKIAKKAGCIQSSVWYRRKKLGIGKSNVRAIDWTQWDRLLGKETDCEVAKRIGCSQSTVTVRRQKLGIKPNKKARIDWSRWDYLLGTKTDKEVAKSIGCEREAVTSRRYKLGIPRSQMKGWKKLSCPVEVTTTTPIEIPPEMRAALKSLDPRTRDILMRRFGIGRNRETLKRIGKGYGLTRERIRQLEEMGLQRLQFLLRRI